MDEHTILTPEVQALIRRAFRPRRTVESFEKELAAPVIVETLRREKEEPE